MSERSERTRRLNGMRGRPRPAPTDRCSPDAIRPVVGLHGRGEAIVGELAESGIGLRVGRERRIRAGREEAT